MELSCEPYYYYNNYISCFLFYELYVWSIGK
jgi:hypothetical protein